MNLKTGKNILETAVHYERYRLRLSEILTVVLLSAVLSFLFSFLFYDALFPGIVLAVPVFVIVRRYMEKALNEKRQKRLKQQFLGAAELLSDFLRSGNSVENGIRLSVKELVNLYGDHAEIVGEWRRICIGMSISESVEGLLEDFGKRSAVSEIREFTEVFSVVKRTGGQIREVLGKVIETLSESFRAEARIETMIAAKRLEQRLMSIIPIGLLLYIKLVSEDMLLPMYTTFTGRIVMTASLGIYVGAFFIAERIMNIRV